MTEIKFTVGDHLLHTSRRRFLQQTFAFSAFASLTSARFMHASPVVDASLANLLVVGDWGYDEDHVAQTAVASAMNRYAQQYRLRTQALLMLGDNWYGELAGGALSPRWQKQFEEMYPADVFSCPAYAIPGNHDYQRWPESKVAAELEYAQVGRNTALPTRWTMPSLWYRFDFPPTKPLITFIALDSNMPFSDGIETHGVNFTLTPQQQVEELAWLEAELKRPRTTPFLIVIGHHPVYSNGIHGDHPILIRDWDPLFRKEGVHLYLAGHDHDMQHLEFEGHPTSFVISGGGGAELTNPTIDPAQRGPYGQKVYGFSHLSATEDRMTLRHLDSNGSVLHAFTKSVDGKVSIL
ncbi:metallophosphoesterase [Acidipila sp. 4G-K13]|uniref:Metallophosphoesterase n=2 Tax=Paracidobacterium acidisoli TaxID=2303751 RepID=A0A372INM4_9BACT|nr:metallophosphoesterase [Paracidobacterium acidisoli]MBT9332028.1 metallophosphoesterase [Paracidobacterium acidisoli]